MKKKDNGASQIRSLRDLRLDDKNANRHTQRGSGLMANSIRDCGFGDSLTVDKDGVVISGNQRLETLAEIQMDNPIVVQTDGTRPVVHQRTDLTVDSKRARELAIYQNRVGQVNLDWDAGILKSLSDDGLADLDKFFSAEELERLFKTAIESGDAGNVNIESKYAVLIECENEATQTELLERFEREGLKCKALLS
jgi:hypothetical protein